MIANQFVQTHMYSYMDQKPATRCQSRLPTLIDWYMYVVYAAQVDRYSYNRATPIYMHKEYKFDRLVCYEPVA